MLLMSTLTWVIIGVVVVAVAVFIGTKLKDKYYQKQAGQLKAGQGGKIPPLPRTARFLALFPSFMLFYWQPATANRRPATKYETCPEQIHTELVEVVEGRYDSRDTKYETV